MQIPSFIVVLMLASSLLGVAYGQANQTCNALGSVTPIQNFTTDRILGNWYFIQFTPKRAEDMEPIKSFCLEHDIQRTHSETFPLTWNESEKTGPGEGPTFTSPGYVMISEETPAAWKIFGFQGDTIKETDIVYLHTDYENWSIQYFCSVRDNYRWEYMTIMTRTRTPSKELMDELDDIIENLGFPKEYALPVFQTDC